MVASRDLVQSFNTAVGKGRKAIHIRCNHPSKNFMKIRLQPTLRALNSRNYRLFFFGQGLSLIGTWMTQVAGIWLVYRLTSSPLLLGVLGFVSQSPGFLAPLAGSLVDRWNRRQVLIVTQAISMLQSLVLAALALTHLLNIWHLIILSFVQGVINALDLPARQALLPEMVAKQDLENAIALNASLLGIARLIGPALAGVLTASVGAGVCFLIDGISYIAVLAALFAMNIPQRKSFPRSISSWQELTSGFTYAFRSVPIRSVLLLLALVNFMGTPLIALGSIFAQDVLGGGSHTFGFLLTTSAVGGVIGAIYLSSRSGVRGLETLFCFAAAMLGVVLVVFAQSRILWLSLVAIAWIGFFLIIENAASSTILLSIVEEDRRGRVMGIYTVASDAIMIPCGNLLAGVLAHLIGAPNTMTIQGVCCLLGALIWVRYLPVLKHSLNRKTA